MFGKKKSVVAQLRERYGLTKEEFEYIVVEQEFGMTEYKGKVVPCPSYQDNAYVGTEADRIRITATLVKYNILRPTNGRDESWNDGAYSRR